MEKHFNVINKKHGEVVASFTSLRDAELFVSTGMTGALEIVPIETVDCAQPLNLFISQGGLRK